jgi:hypothetical protein
MPSGVIDYVAYGSLDTHLTGNPQITYFKTVYRRHCNFAIESIEQTFIQQPQFGKKTIVQLAKLGDLVQNMYLEITLPQLPTSPNYIYGVGNAVIKSVELSIGGFVIDHHYSDWLNIWSELTTDAGILLGYDTMVGNFYNRYGSNEITFYVPLMFWFNRNPGLALPLVAIQYSEVQLIFEFNPVSILSSSMLTTSQLKCRLYCDYIFLDTDERRIFGQSMHEYLIEQLQYVEHKITAGTRYYPAKLEFNLPVKELIWCNSSSNVALNGNDYGLFDYSLDALGSDHSFTSGKLTFGSGNRFIERDADYFYLVQNYQRHTHGPRTSKIHTTYDGTFTKLNTNPFRNFIYTYSFALDPENHQPSGSCNFSRLNGVQLQLNYPNTTYDFTLKVFAINYNILKIGSGMAGLAYSN